MGKTISDAEWTKILNDVHLVHAILDELLAKRLELGISRREMAVRLKISDYKLQKFESESSKPTLEMIQRYARALNMNVSVSLESY